MSTHRLLLGLALVLIGPLHARADGDDTLKKVDKWYDGLRTIELVATSEGKFVGGSPLSGVVVSKRKYKISRDQDNWTVQIEMTNYDPEKRKLTATKFTDMKVGPKGLVITPRQADGTILDNIIVDPQRRPDQLGLLFDKEIGAYFGYLNGNTSNDAMLRRGELKQESTTIAGRACTVVSSTSPWGKCFLTVDSSIDFAPLRFRTLVESNDLLTEKMTLAQRPKFGSPLYFDEPARSIETVYDVVDFTTTSPRRVKSWRITTTTTYETGKSVVLVVNAIATYPAQSATAGIAPIPVGTSAYVVGDDNRTERVWDGQRAVRTGELTTVERIREVTTESPNRSYYTIGVVVVVLAGVGIGIYRLRRARG